MIGAVFVFLKIKSNTFCRVGFTLAHLKYFYIYYDYVLIILCNIVCKTPFYNYPYGERFAVDPVFTSHVFV